MAEAARMRQAMLQSELTTAAQTLMAMSVDRSAVRAALKCSAAEPAPAVRFAAGFKENSRKEVATVRVQSVAGAGEQWGSECRSPTRRPLTLLADNGLDLEVSDSVVFVKAALFLDTKKRVKVEEVATTRVKQQRAAEYGGLQRTGSGARVLGNPNSDCVCGFAPCSWPKKACATSGEPSPSTAPWART